MRYASRLPVVLAVAAVAAAAAVLLGRGGSAPAVQPAAAVAVRASFDRRVAQLGDALTARVVVTLDRGAVRSRTLRVSDDLAPFSPLAAPATARTVSGRLETVAIAQRVACLTAPCLAGRIALPRVRIAVTGRNGTTETASTAWRAPRLRSRVDAKDLAAASPRFAADATPAAPTYRLAPGAAETTLQVVAGVAAAGAAALLALEGLALARRRRPADGDELARALRLVRESEGRPVHDRRRALALLARLLHGPDGALGRAASDLAWSRPAPDPPAVDALATRVESERAG